MEPAPPFSDEMSERRGFLRCAPTANEDEMSEEEITGQEPDNDQTPEGQEPKADDNGASDSKPPWGDDDFDPAKAWTLVQNLRSEVDELKADRRKANEAKEEAERQAREAEEAKLAENEEYKTLAEKRAERLLELEPLEPKVAELEQERDRYKAALNAHIAAQMEGIPAYVVELLEGKDPIEKLEYIAKHGETFRKGGKGSKPQPEVESPNGPGTLTPEEKRQLAALPGRDY